jgi:hypothetical protein
MSDHILRESVEELVEAAVRRGFDAGYAAAVKDIVAWLRGSIRNRLADRIMRGEAKGASNE